MLFFNLPSHPHASNLLSRGRLLSVGACTVPPDGGFDGYVELFADAAAAIDGGKSQAIAGAFVGAESYAIESCS